MNIVEKEKDLIRHVIDGNFIEVKKLLEEKVSANLYINNETPLLCHTIAKDKEKISLLLLSHGADPCLPDSRGQNSLMLSTKVGREKIFNYITSLNIKIDCRDKKGQTAFMYAAWNCNFIALKTLKAKGANPLSVDKYDRTSLSWAAHSYFIQCNKRYFNLKDAFSVIPEKFYIESLNFLIPISAQVINKSDSLGQTALMFAAPAGNNSIVEELLKYGANTYIQDHKKMTAEQYAKRYKNKLIIDTLSKHEKQLS